jgi:protocatechuate 3,4-dioxygenase beta subunit
MSKITLTLLLLAVFSLGSEKKKCGCVPAAPEVTTRWGNQNVIIKNEGVVQSLRGKVVGSASHRAMEGVLVEVYDKPEGLLMDWKEREERKRDQRRVAACVTGANGEFCFTGIPPGKYELRCSKPIEWDPTSVYVVVGRRTRLNKNLEVPLYMSR